MFTISFWNLILQGTKQSIVQIVKCFVRKQQNLKYLIFKYLNYLHYLDDIGFKSSRSF